MSAGGAGTSTTYDGPARERVSIRAELPPYERGLTDEKDRFMSRKYTALLALAAMIAAMPLLSACNTTAGAGQDLRAAGKGIENSADRNKPY